MHLHLDLLLALRIDHVLTDCDHPALPALVPVHPHVDVGTCVHTLTHICSHTQTCMQTHSWSSSKFLHVSYCTPTHHLLLLGTWEFIVTCPFPSPHIYPSPSPLNLFPRYVECKKLFPLLACDQFCPSHIVLHWDFCNSLLGDLLTSFFFCYCTYRYFPCNQNELVNT